MKGSFPVIQAPPADIKILCYVLYRNKTSYVKVYCSRNKIFCYTVNTAKKDFLSVLLYMLVRDHSCPLHITDFQNIFEGIC